MTERKPNARWESSAGGLWATLYLRTLNGICIETVDARMHGEGWRWHVFGASIRLSQHGYKSMKEAQLAAEDALRKLLTEALAELDGG